MADYVKINKTDDRIDLWFLNENDEPFAVGEKLYATTGTHCFSITLRKTTLSFWTGWKATPKPAPMSLIMI